MFAIDFGTSYTVAAVQVDGRAPEVIEIGGERRIPSVVLVDPDGHLIVGRAADDLSVTHPAGTLRALKNRLGDQAPVIVSGRPHQVVALVAALLGDVYEQVLRQMGGPPREVRLSHPATWNQQRLGRLVEAATKAGLANPQLVPEPVAAALSYASEVGIATGQSVAVYDLGGGTFDSAVVTARDGQFVIVGRPSGDQHIGGELFDEMLVEHLLDRLPAVARDSIETGDEPVWRQVGATLRNEARRAKESLSLHPYVDVIVPLPSGLSQTRLTRVEFDDIVRPYVAETVTLLERCIGEAGLQPTDLAAISLVGGASRSPIVEAMVGAAFGSLPISRRGDPKAAVALGAARAVMASPKPPVGDVPTQPASPGTAPEAVRLGLPSGPAAAPWPHETLATPAAGSSATVVDPPATVSPRRRRGRVAFALFVVIVLAAVGAVILARRNDSSSGSRASTVVDGPPASSLATDPAFVADGNGSTSTEPVDSSAGPTSVETVASTAPTVAVGTALLTLSGATGQTLSAVFSPDGSMVAAASLDGRARLFDATSGDLRATLEGHTDEVYSVAFSPDSRRLVTASADRTARVWDTATGAGTAVLDGHADVVYEASFSADGSRVVTASADGTARVWDAATGGQVATLSGHREAVYSAVFSPDGTLVATGGQDDTVMVWDPTTGNVVYMLQGHTADVQTVAFSPDGTLLVSAGDDGTVIVWDVASGTPLHTLSGHMGKVWMAVFSPDGTLVLSGGMDGSVRLWRVDDGSPMDIDKAHIADVYGVAFNPDGSRYVAASLDGTASVWGVASHALLATLDGGAGMVFTAQFDPSGTRIVTSGADGVARVWAG